MFDLVNGLTGLLGPAHQVKPNQKGTTDVLDRSSVRIHLITDAGKTQHGMRCGDNPAHKRKAV